MQRHILQISLHQTAVTNSTQTMNRLGQMNRSAIELGQEILQLRGVRLQGRQVRPDIRIIDVRQTDCLDVSLQHGFAVIPHLQILERQRIQRTA